MCSQLQCRSFTSVKGKSVVKLQPLEPMVIIGSSGAVDASTWM